MHYLKNIRDLKVKDLEGIDFIIHLVTNIPYSIKNPVVTSNDNIQMTVGLLDIATKANAKLIFSSTASLCNNLPWTEDMVKSSQPYCWQKYAECYAKCGQKIFWILFKTISS